MGWFSGIGHALGGAVRGVDSLANKINPMQGAMMWANKQAGGIPLIGKPLEKIGNWSTTHPAEAAALAASVYFGGGALLSAYGGGAGAAGAGAAGAAGEGTAMGSAAGTLGAADSAAASAQLGLTAADVGGMGAAGAGAGAAAGGAGTSMLTVPNAMRAYGAANMLAHLGRGGSPGAGGNGAQLAMGAYGPYAAPLQANQYQSQVVDPSQVGSTQRPYQLPDPGQVAGYNSLASGQGQIAGHNPLANGYMSWLMQQNPDPSAQTPAQVNAGLAPIPIPTTLRERTQNRLMFGSGQ